MTAEEQRKQVILNVADMLRHNPFTFEFKVKKKPQGIKVIYEVTQEQMNDIVEKYDSKTESKATGADACRR